MEIDWKKKYEEALNKARELHGTVAAGRDFLAEIFPELCESDDERIRKAIIELLKEVGRDDTGISENAKCMISYLERQKDSPMPEDTVIFQKGVEEGRRLEREDIKKGAKPAEWSREDKRKINRIYAILGQAADTHAYSTTCRLIGDKEAVELQDFLRSIAKQKSGEWSEEDDAHLKWICRIIHSQVVNKKLSLEEESKLGKWMDKWLNHKPQSHWKPSEEQMKVFFKANPVNLMPEELLIYQSLYDDLTKLL